MNDFDRVTRALSNGSRRQILCTLREEDRIQPFSGEQGGDCTTKLHHTHLPLLEEDNLVTWNQETGIVKRGDDFESIEPILAALGPREDTFPDEYLPEGEPC